jgi:hypothetical protein
VVEMRLWLKCACGWNAPVVEMRLWLKCACGWNAPVVEMRLLLKCACCWNAPVGEMRLLLKWLLRWWDVLMVAYQSTRVIFWRFTNYSFGYLVIVVNYSGWFTILHQYSEWALNAEIENKRSWTKIVQSAFI